MKIKLLKTEKIDGVDNLTFEVTKEVTEEVTMTMEQAEVYMADKVNKLEKKTKFLAQIEMEKQELDELVANIKDIQSTLNVEQTN